MRYAHMVTVYENLGWKVEETDTGLAVLAGPADLESGTGFVRIGVKVGPMDDRQEKLGDAARELADQMFLAMWSVVSKPPAPEVEKKDPESQIILPFPSPKDSA